MSARRCNPCHMTEAARLAELGSLLAKAFRRLQQISKNGVDESSQSERACAPAAPPEPPTPR
jgi:hypothetical protein